MIEWLQLKIMTLQAWYEQRTDVDRNQWGHVETADGYVPRDGDRT